MANEKRLIDAYQFRGKHEVAEVNGKLCSVICYADIVNAPTVDAVEVVHGRWIFGTANHREYMKCSVCLKSQTPTGVFTYCPNCGAKMDGGNEDD